MSGELAINLSADLNATFFTKVLGNNINSELNLSQSLGISVTGGDIIDISTEAYSQFTYSNSQSTFSNPDNIFNHLKSLSPELAEKYLAVRNLLASISENAAESLDKSMKSILKQNENTVEPKSQINAFSKIKTKITVEAEDGKIFQVEVTMSGSISITEGANKTKDPILVDFENDGIGFNTKKQFDIDEDGQNEMVNWVSKNDGVLFADYDKNGQISNMSEMFGDSEKFSNGIQKLLSFDHNNDALINSLDSIFKELKIEKGDGTVYSMNDLNISQITVNGENIILETNKNNISGGDYLFNYREMN